MGAVSIKSLERQEKNMLDEIQELNNKKADINKILMGKNSELQKIRSRLKQLKSNVILTDHAIVRYLERVEKVDIEKIKKILLDDKTAELIKTMQPSKIKRDSYSLLIIGSTITTVITNEKR